MGGWVSKNIFHFGKSLPTKSLWCSMFHGGLWSEVVKGKYFKSLLVVDWCRASGPLGRISSNIWNNISSSFLVLGEWLVFQIDDGKNVLCGYNHFIKGYISINVPLYF